MTTGEIESLRKEQQRIDRKVVEYSIKLLKPFYEKRRSIVRQIPRFWATVVGDTEPWRPYITFEDSLAFDALEDVWIKWDDEDTRNFTAHFKFGDNIHFSPQTLTKTLYWHAINDDDEEGFYESKEPTYIDLKPGQKLLEQHLHGGDESFFTWFSYTSTDKKDDRQENTIIAQLLVDELYPAAIDLYRAAQEEQDIADEYDISEDE